MVETREVTLEGGDGSTAVTLVQLPSMRAVRLLPRLGRIVGPVFAAAGGGNLLEQDVSKLGSALDEMLQRLSPDELEALIRELLGNAKIGTKDLMPVFDNVFRGRTLQIFLLLKHALDLNYGDFSAALAGLYAQGRARAGASPSGSPQT
jgi:hypothetical protein